jgi:hypothetical protein
MTAQVHDRFDFEGRPYRLVGVKGGKLFDPKQFGLKTVARSTACQRGYQCRYTVEHDRLLLARLEISLGEYLEIFDTPFGPTPGGRFTLQVGPALNGVHPIKPNPKDSDHNNLYEELNMEIQYTGRILIAEGFIRELYVHMGYQPAWKYKTVLELTFEEGKLLRAYDVSGKMKAIRGLLARGPILGPDTDAEARLNWVASTFSLDYDW